VRFASLGSGSSGNATVVSSGETHLLVDCGFSGRETQRRLQRLGLELADISALLVTHEHGDHIRGVPTIARQWGMPIYMTRGTRAAVKWKDAPGAHANIHRVLADERFDLGDITVHPVPVPHDAREPVQYCFSARGKSIGLLTDLGSYSDGVVAAFSGCHALLLEANHDTHMLAYGSYPYPLKRRVAGPWGHLSNDQAASLLSMMDTVRLQHLVVGHISRKNNDLELVKKAFAQIQIPQAQIAFACQDEGFGWLDVV
jgi:phosphoribosyl 1,2-cyclic phosphodiesterase